MVNQEYVNWLVNFIKNSIINVKTGNPFTIDDVKNADYKSAVQAVLNAQTATS